METVLITGAARRLGGFIAETLASDGCFVWIHYLSHEKEAFILRDRIEKNGGRADCVRCDLTNTGQIDRMLRSVSDSDNGKLTTLINNASVFLRKPLAETSADDWDRVMETNLKAVWYLSNRFAERYPSAKRIISIGDASISNGMRNSAVYGLSKFALKYLTEQMASAFAPKISVNILSPGLVMKGDGEPDAVWQKRLERAITGNDDILTQIMTGIRYLMGDPGMTGSELFVDNGVHLYNKLD